MFSSHYQIDLSNIISNVQYYKSITCKKVCSVIKADAYSHGAVRVAKKLQSTVEMFAVANASEAKRLLRGNITTDILILAVEERYIYANNIIYAVDSVQQVSRLKQNDTRSLRVHIKVNTGMNRYGVNDESVIKDIVKCCDLLGVGIEGIFSHIYDSVDTASVTKQLSIFDQYIAVLRKAADRPLITHILSSSTALQYNDLRYDMIRIGLGQYLSLNDGLHNAKSLHSYVKSINLIVRGDNVGYGSVTFDQDIRVVVVPLGYADGLDRRMSGKCHVFILGKAYPIVGKMCMDCTFVKVDSTVQVGDKVTFFDDRYSLKTISASIESDEYEQVIRTKSDRIPRKYINNILL